VLNRSTGHVMKQRDCNFDSMSNAELWDFYTELRSTLAAKLEAEAALLQERLDELQRHVAGAPARCRARPKHAAVAKFRNPRPPVPDMVGQRTTAPLGEGSARARWNDGQPADQRAGAPTGWSSLSGVTLSAPGRWRAW
jgi:hypothetical protein